VAEVLYYAIPAFVLLLVVELLSFKHLRDDDLVGYEARDTRTSLVMGGGNVVSLIYQFWIHTERVKKLPAPIELVFNTPSHHRVHHGANEVYLDRNYGGILIIWDRFFGTHQGETERVRYGLTKNIRSFRPAQVAFHEFVDLAHDVRAAKSWRHKLGYVLRGPGWSPDGSGSGGTRG
jgi:hypothetical protein